MLKFEEIGDYRISAHIFVSEEISVDIAFKGEFPAPNRFLINKFKSTPKNNEIFKSLFIYFSSKKKHSDFVDFFSHNGYFYCVFAYKKAPKIVSIYNRDMCTASFEERIKIFENILIKIYDILVVHRAPQIIIKNIVKPQNILVDSANIDYFNYDLRDLSFEEGFGERTVIKSISKIISTMFEIELSSRYNKAIQIVFKSCKYGIYNSLPMLMADFKDKYEEAKISSFLQFLKQQFMLRRYLIPRITSMIMIPSLITAFVYLIYSKIHANEKKVDSAQAVMIGEISYAAGTEDKSNKEISMELVNIPLNTTQEPDEPIVLSPDAPIEFEDHIVKFGETIDSICKENYPSDSFISGVASFNALEPTDSLVPGSILRLPNGASVSLYLESQQNVSNSENSND
ncbi:MAG: hypothetical protein LBP36_00485 [Oscillospiraceae bacterium]|jgi:hypothetical protein|nr:hypothetical protein [Oscillospiraceae bacterium]